MELFAYPIKKKTSRRMMPMLMAKTQTVPELS